jgi:hypothetical protein
MVALTLLSTLVLGGLADGAAPVRPHVPQPALGVAQSGEKPKKKKVIRLDALTVEGRIQKPQAFYILQRSNLNFEELNRTESFVEKIDQTVEKAPF